VQSLGKFLSTAVSMVLRACSSVMGDFLTLYEQAL